MVVLVVFRALVVKDPGLQLASSSGSMRNEPDMPRWRDQHHAIIEIGKQIFCPAAQRDDLPAFKPFCKIRRKGKSQIARALCSTRMMLPRLPSPAARPRRTVSTSGSSGKSVAAHQS
jgi:hypothetical protein